MDVTSFVYSQSVEGYGYVIISHHHLIAYILDVQKRLRPVIGRFHKLDLSFNVSAT